MNGDFFALLCFTPWTDRVGPRGKVVVLDQIFPLIYDSWCCSVVRRSLWALVFTLFTNRLTLIKCIKLLSVRTTPYFTLNAGEIRMVRNHFFDGLDRFNSGLIKSLRTHYLYYHKTLHKKYLWIHSLKMIVKNILCKLFNRIIWWHITV